MPNELADFAPYKAFDAVLTACKSIAKSGGYNTQPYVTSELERDGLEGYKHIIWVSPGTPYLDFDEVDSGPSWELEQRIDIFGNTAAERGDTLDELHSLMQDTLTAVSLAYTAISTACSGTVIEYEPMETDRMQLLQDGQASFGFSLVITYRQGATW